MAAFKYVHLIPIIIIISLTTTTGAVVGLQPVKAAYWPTWSISYFPPSSIDTTLFTHIYYAFVSPNNVTFKFEESNSTASLLREFTTTLHGKNPPVKTLISIAGGGDATLYARMASNARTRELFIKSAIDLAREFGFDGLDLDWEFPNDPKEMMDMGRLFEEWRVAIQIEAQKNDRPPLLLTAAVYFSVDFFLSGAIHRKYPVDSISRYLDWASPMCYDYHGSWDTSQTGAHAALYDGKSNISTSYGLQSWIGAGVPANKLVMGLPLYGRTWKLKDPNINGIGAPAVGLGPGDGVLTFLQVEHYNGNNSATVVYDVDSVSTYSYVGTSWMGYDDVKSTTTKIGFAKAHGLLGYFFWAVSYDNEGKIAKEASRAWIDD